MAVAYSSPSGVPLTFSARAWAIAWSNALVPEEMATAKASRVPKGSTEAELIEAALDVGLELGLETLPAKARKGVDVAAARRVARQRLRAGSFRKNLAALDEAQRGLQVLVGASRDPSLVVLRDVERLAASFGLNSRQAEAIVRETRALVDAGKNTDAIKRAMKKRVRQALEARADLLSQTLGRDAIATAQQALYEQAAKQGLLDEDKQLREWVTRRDEKVCPICDAIDGQRAPIGEPFESDIDGEEYDQPPVHPRCRCMIRLVRVVSPKRGRRVA